MAKRQTKKSKYGDDFSNLCCSFCGKPQREVEHLTAGPTVYICNECVDLCIEIQVEAADREDRKINEAKKSHNYIPQEIKKALDDHIIGQERAKKVLSVAVYNHYKRIKNPKLNLGKSNILMIGPSGCGKTELVKQIAKILDVPFTIADATSLTESGYVGADVETILSGLINAADGDLKRAERGIVYIDEIDKLASTDSCVSTTKDVGGKGVQQALLKLIEGSEVSFQKDRARHHPQAESDKIKTDNILFIVGGAFVGLDKIVEARYFNKKDHILPEDLYKFGLIPEFVGRLPMLVELEALTKQDLIDILTKPKNSIVKQYQNTFKADKIDLEFTSDALEYTAEQALKRNTGARGLRAILEDAMINVMFDLPSKKNISKCTVTTEVIQDGAYPELTSKTKKGKAKK
jgi:ATP-dependent Clp protease ATP-binding subunit ClpX